MPWVSLKGSYIPRERALNAACREQCRPADNLFAESGFKQAQAGKCTTSVDHGH